MDRVNQFANDSVLDYQPISFAGSFVRKMRKQKGLANIPSIRTTIAIPRFITARYWRKEALDPIDYYHAAVYCTPHVDQEIAKKIAYEMLFPKSKQPKKKQARTQSDNTQSGEKPKITGLDQIMDELSEAGFDDLLEVMDEETDFTDLLEEQNNTWDFLEELIHSNHVQDQARIKLLEELESEYAVIQHYLNTRELIDRFIQEQMAQMAGIWPPSIFQPAIDLELNEQLKRHAQMPWEISLAMNMTNDPSYENYLQDILQVSNAHSLGTTLRYHQKNNREIDEDWVDAAFDKIETMSDYYEMLRGIQEYRKPPSGLLERAPKHNIRESLDLAEQIDTKFGVNHSHEIFEAFKQETNQNIPSLKQTQDATYDDGNKGWESILEVSIQEECMKLDQQALSNLSKEISSHVSPRLTPNMKRFQTNQAKEIATKSIEKIDVKDKFLPQLEHLIEYGVIPHYDRVVSSGRKLGISEEAIANLYKDPIQVLESYINSNTMEVSKYDKVIKKITSVPSDRMKELLQKASTGENNIAMAALGAADLGTAMTAGNGMTMPDGSGVQEAIADAMNKSIGGGENLLKQWFSHRKRLPKALQERLKAMMRDALLEIGMEWANRGTGSSEEGIIPVTTTRPYRPGDELDLIDIEATLETLMSSGKKLDQITADEFMVTETSKGKTSLGVLIDISGSMSGSHLAMCAIAVVMLLGKLEEKEIAVALFESNTHSIKGFNDLADINKVADELLDLQARGGTRAQSALQWINEEFDSVTDSEVKILYFLSDFFLVEKGEVLENLCEPMRSLGVKILAAYHGRYNNDTLQTMVEALDGTLMHISDFSSLPLTISESISMIT